VLKRVIAGWNAAPGAPADWDPARDGDCGALPIRVYPAQALRPGGPRLQWVESAWEPTPREMRALALGRSIILRIIGWQPPVALYVDAEKPQGDLGVDDAATWIVRSAAASDVLFAGPSGESQARAAFEAASMVGPCSLFREVARS
jgi:hypothetical protein